MALHNCLHLYVHLVWRTWDSLPLITPAVERRLHRAIEAEAAGLGGTVLAVGGTEEHVHVLVRIPATMAIAEVVKRIKGATSRFANEELLPGQFRWQGHYGAFTVSHWDTDRVRDYVRDQRRHHADGDTIECLEESSTEGPGKALE